MARILIFDEYPSIRNLLAEELAGEGNVIFSSHYPKGDPHLDQAEGFIRKSCFLEELRQCVFEILRRPDLAASR